MTSSLLITGPPGSGKSRLALERFSSLPDSLLLTPTATMAEHVRNQLARAGAAVRPSRITTLAHFVDLRTGDSRTALAPAPQPVLHLLIEQALSRGPTEQALSGPRWPRFAAVAAFPGFHQAVAALMEEVPVHSLTGAFQEELKQLFEEVETGLARRGMALRNTRLRSCGARLRASHAGAGLRPVHVILDGFFTFSPAELDLVEDLAAVSAVTLTLPDWPGAQAARRRLRSAGFAEQRCTDVLRSPRRITFAAPTMEREIEEIARRILEHAAQGRAFRDMGIVLRTRDPYGLALETAFARFSIPARFYFADSLSAHAAVAYLSGLVGALLGGWDHASLLTLLRMPVSGLGATPEGDRFDFDLRKRLPGAGLPLHGMPDVPPAAVSLAAIDWVRDRMSPQDWAARLKTMRALLPEPAIADQTSPAQIWKLRSTAAAVEAFDDALDQTAAALAGEERMTLAAFWRHADTVLSLEPLRIADRRRNVVHILDVFEARQWELPIVFVCGLTERHFPQYHREDPLLHDQGRRRAGLETSVDRQAQERFLFELAATRPTEQLVLSYARFNERGEPALPSFFLDGAKAEACETRVRPRGPQPLSKMADRQGRVAEKSGAQRINDPPLLERLAQVHKKLAPTSIESFLQCPFQFFAGKTLRLRKRPPVPRDRLDVLLQGSILHRALAEFARFPLLGATVFDQVFTDESHRARVPATYRTEAVRLELRRHFAAFIADRQVHLGWASRVEEEFTLALSATLAISGRIDRLDVGPRNQALVIDYKYSAGDKIRERVENSISGDLVQAGLYLLAAARVFGLDPAGMLYCGLRNEVVWDGWHAPVPGLEAIGESMTPAALHDFMNRAAAKAEETSAAIASGRVAPQPADPRKCAWCDLRDICRIEIAAAALTVGAP